MSPVSVISRKWRSEGVKFVACKMTIDMMGLSKDDFIEGVTIETAEQFLKYAKDCNICLFT